MLVLVLAGLLYVFTCAPAILWQDSGLFVYRIWHNDIEGDLGIALSHPLYVMIGIAVKYIPFGDLAHRINLISAVFGAIAVANLFVLLRLWLGRVMPAIVGAATLAVSWTFWSNAVIAECYTLFAAQFFLELILLLQYVRTKRVGYLYLLGLVNGLTIANHLWGVFGLLCYAVLCFVLLAHRQIKWKHFGIVILLWIIGAAPYEYLVVKNLLISGDVGGTLASAFFGASWQNSVLNTALSAKIVFENIVFILLNFPTPNFVLLFAGLWLICKKTTDRVFANVVLVLVLMHFAFAFRYTVPDRHVFFLPFYCLAAVVVGLGAEFVLSRFSSRAVLVAVTVFAFLPAAAYAVMPEIGRRYYKPLAERRQRPYRDEYKYWLQPWKTGYRGAERFANEALDLVEENAIIYAYTTDVHALLYLQEVKGKRKDVRITSYTNRSANAADIGKGVGCDSANSAAVYVVSPIKGYCPDFILEDYDFVKEGVLYRAVTRN